MLTEISAREILADAGGPEEWQELRCRRGRRGWLFRPIDDLDILSAQAWMVTDGGAVFPMFGGISSTVRGSH